MALTTVSIFSLFFLIGNISAKHLKIIKGENAYIKDFPHIVSLRIFGEHFCAGSIISDRHVLTAAHCVENFNNFNKHFIRIHSGTSRSDRKGTVHELLSVHIHPEWKNDEKEGWANDIAVLTLSNPIVFNKKQKKINLSSHNVQNYQTGYAIGWGKTSNGLAANPKRLQKLKVNLLLSDECGPLLTHKITEKQICSFNSVDSGICYGDSGGPLVSDGEIVGVVSFVDEDDCTTGVPDVYTNVFAYKDFIETIINDKM